MHNVLALIASFFILYGFILEADIDSQTENCWLEMVNLAQEDSTGNPVTIYEQRFDCACDDLHKFAEEAWHIYQHTMDNDVAIIYVGE